MTDSTSSVTGAPVVAAGTIHNIQVLLKWLFGLVPILAGLDKFTNLLTDWPRYLDPRLAVISPAAFMHIVGPIEIVAGILVFAKTKFGAYLVMVWLLAIALQLVVQGQHFDVAVRDIVLALGGAWTLARLTPASRRA